MDEKKLTIMNIWSYAGPIWMTIVGLGCIGIGAGSQLVAFIVIGTLLVLGAIALFILIGMRNAKIQGILARQNCRTTCNNCNKEFEYTGNKVIRHKRWPQGYIDCPYCRAHNGHTVENIQ